MPCYEQRTYTNKLIEMGSSVIDKKALETGAGKTGLRLTTGSMGAVNIYDERNYLLASLKGNTLTMRQDDPERREEIINRVRQAYSVGVVVNQAAKQYWSPTVVKEGNQYRVITQVDY